MNTALNTLTLRTLAAVVAATTWMASANALPIKVADVGVLRGTAPIVRSGGTTVFNPEAAAIDLSGTPSRR